MFTITPYVLAVENFSLILGKTSIICTEILPVSGTSQNAIVTVSKLTFTCDTTASASLFPNQLVDSTLTLIDSFTLGTDFYGATSLTVSAFDTNNLLLGIANIPIVLATMTLYPPTVPIGNSLTISAASNVQVSVSSISFSNGTSSYSVPVSSTLSTTPQIVTIIPVPLEFQGSSSLFVNLLSTD